MTDCSLAPNASTVSSGSPPRNDMKLDVIDISLNGRILALLKPDRLTLAAFLLVVLLGGSNSVAIRFSNQELAPFWGAFLRFSVGACVYWLILLVRRVALPSPRDAAVIAVNGFLAIGVSFALLYWALLRVPVSLATIIISTSPLFTLVLAVLHRLEKFRVQSLVGGLIAVVGLAVAVNAQPGGAELLPAILALVLGALVGCRRQRDLQDVFPAKRPCGDQLDLDDRWRALPWRRVTGGGRCVGAAVHAAGLGRAHLSDLGRLGGDVLHVRVCALALDGFGGFVCDPVLSAGGDCPCRLACKETVTLPFVVGRAARDCRACGSGRFTAKMGLDAVLRVGIELLYYLISPKGGSKTCKPSWSPLSICSARLRSVS
jgi:uncharacterized membrane protein